MVINVFYKIFTISQKYDSFLYSLYKNPNLYLKEDESNLNYFNIKICENIYILLGSCSYTGCKRNIQG